LWYLLIWYLLPGNVSTIMSWQSIRLKPNILFKQNLFC
jgi:hypothetical protein